MSRVYSFILALLATFTVNAAVFNQFAPATGILKGNANSYITTAATGSDIPAAGSNTQVQFNNSGVLGASSNFIWNGGSNLLNLGASTTPGTFSVGQLGAMTISGTALAVPGFAINSNIQGNYEAHSYSATSAFGSMYYGVRARGTVATPTTVLNGDNLLTIGGAGFDGTNYTWGAHIHFLADGVPSAGVLPGALDFQTTPSASNTPVSRLLIDHSGAYSVNGSFGTAGQAIVSNGAGAAVGWATVAGGVTGLANPSATIGLTANNGVATTAMRSDASPALSQAIVPTWSGIHTFSALYGSANTQAVQVSSAVPAMLMKETDAAVNAQKWVQYVNSSVLNLSILNDAETVQRDWMSIARSTGAISSLAFGNATDNPSYTFLGTGTTTYGGPIVADRATFTPAVSSNTAIKVTGAGSGANPALQVLAASGVASRQIAQFGHTGVSNGVTISSNGTAVSMAMTPDAGTQFLAGDGTAALPSVSFTNDPNTGIYSFTADAVGVSTGGTARAEFTNAGLTIFGTSNNLAFTGAGTSHVYTRWTNTGGDGYIGLDSSTGGNLFSGNAAYSLNIGTSGNTQFAIGTNSIARWLIAGNGSATMNAPTAGNTLAILGFANNYTTVTTGSGTSGQSFGALVRGGTTTADRAFLVQNQSGATSFFEINGVGALAVNNSDFGAAGQVLQSAGSGAITRWSGGAAATTSNESRTSTTTLTNITALSGISLTPGTYALDGYFSFDLSAQPGGAKILFTHTGGVASGFYSYNGTINSAAVTSANLTESVNTLNGSPVSSGDYVAVRGTLIVSGTTTVNVQFAQFSSNGTATTILPGSYIKYYRVN